MFDDLGIRTEDVKSLKEIQRLPFTVKTDLRDNYPFGLFTVPKRDLVRVHASSGTTGKPIVMGYTENDIETWTDLVARIVGLAWVTWYDVAQICFTYGLFMNIFIIYY